MTEHELARLNLLITALDLYNWNLKPIEWDSDSPGAIAIDRFRSAVRRYKSSLRAEWGVKGAHTKKIIERVEAK